MSPQVDPQNQPPEVDPEDLRKYGDAAVRLAQDLAPGELVRWADLANTAASMAEIEDSSQLEIRSPSYGRVPLWLSCCGWRQFRAGHLWPRRSSVLDRWL